MDRVMYHKALENLLTQLESVDGVVSGSMVLMEKVIDHKTLVVARATIRHIVFADSEEGGNRLR